MKKIIIAVAFFLMLCVAFISCKQSIPDDISDSSALISALESELKALKQENSVNESENNKKLDALTSLLNSLMTSEAPASSSASTSADTVANGFTYTVQGGNAIITGYSGSELHIAIPSSIDGYTVTEIGDSAFRDSRIKSVILSESIHCIGWFAFDGCTQLTEITVPSSVKKIGYCAFGSSDSSVTVCCHSGSFALEYAKSYGLSYTII